VGGRRFERRSLLVGVAIAALTIVATGLSLTLPSISDTGAAAPGPTETPGFAVYASASGWQGGDGTLEKPLDLQTALSLESPIRPGGTVWLRGGTYKGTFTSHLMGTEAAPITVRPYSGERVIIDSAPSSNPALDVYGAWTIFRDMEVTNTDPGRETNDAAASNLKRGIGISVHGPDTKIVNTVVHDLVTGIALWSDAERAEAHGNIVFNNGWHGTNRSGGSGISTQNRVETRLITDNIVFNQIGPGLYSYGSDQAYLDYITFEGNVSFNNGILGKGYQPNFLFGGGRVAKRLIVNQNFTYHIPDYRNGGGNNFGYLAGCDELVMRDNYFAHWKTGYPLLLVNCTGTIEGNTFLGTARGIAGDTILRQPEIEKQHPKNRYGGEGPSNAVSFLRPNRYEPGRAHIIVFNWDRQEEVSTSLDSAGIPYGGRFEVRDVQNLMGPVVVSGTYTGSAVRIPMSSLVEVGPAVGFATKPPHTAPEFAVFLVTSRPGEAGIWTSIRAFLGL
jgi:hypothetical protein